MRSRRSAALLSWISLITVFSACCATAWASSETIQKLVLDLQSHSKDDQIRAAQALGEMGSAAEGAVPALVRLMRIDSSQAGRVVTLLALLLKDPALETSVRLRAADLLEQSGPSAEKEIVGLAGLLSDSDGEVRKRVIHLLSRVGPVAAPALTRALQDPRVTVRAGAVQALMEMRPVPSELVPSLEAALNDKDPAVRYLAAEGFGNLGVLAQEAIPALVQALRVSRGQDPVLKNRAETLLKSMRHESS